MSEDTRIETAADATTHEEWLARLDEIADDLGYLEPLGKAHHALFVDDGPTLLVTFETVDAIRARDGQMPMGYTLARGEGWSHLCIMAEGETWYRDPAVFGYFDRLVDDAFFEDFDRVVFYGAGMGGYGAAAYSVCAPGATVLAVQPLATLDPLIAGWDRRHFHKRRLDFSTRYGYAPDMTEGAGEVFVIYDPQETLDAMHSALFTRPFVTMLRCRNLGGTLESTLTHLGILSPMLTAACEGRLTAAAFWQLYRARRDYGPYLRTLMGRIDTGKRTVLAALLCRNVASRLTAPRFKRRFAELQEEIAALGIELPKTAAEKRAARG
ncbi:MAG: phosphoadenosine phosphosulfate reductase [Paracoccaceae bacterium]|nr:phosphoadenosine phosphosulfate reductase [Paracoccaceae bacterium]